MQRSDGGLTDGDRGPLNVHTEPHMDAFSLFVALHKVTGEDRWKIAADDAWEWFQDNAAHPEIGEIYQGMWDSGPSTIFATDAYSWTMYGPGGDRMSPSELKAYTGTMLSKSLTKVTLDLPDGSTRSVILVDFTDPQDPNVQDKRNGFHPMGTNEWAGGVIGALQKNAVRLWDTQDPEHRTTAIQYKARAEYMTEHSLKAFYEIPGLEGLLTFYATGQNVETGHGWKTPFFYVQGPGVDIKGGSLVGAFSVLPIQGLNPFQLEDSYKITYDGIPLNANDEAEAIRFVALSVVNRSFREIVPTEIPDDAPHIVESAEYNGNMWNAFLRGNYEGSIGWATRVVSDPAWIRLAQRDQQLKANEIDVKKS